MNLGYNKKKFIIILFRLYFFIVNDLILYIIYILDKLKKKLIH